MIWKWDQRFLDLAKFVSQWSKDPSTKVGGVIVDEHKRVISLGFNGFAKGVKDTEERYSNRELKYSMVVHAEVNALLFAERDVTGCTLYTYPFAPCSSCASLVIQSGIKRVVAPHPTRELLERWGDSLKLAKTLFFEAGVELDLVKSFEF